MSTSYPAPLEVGQPSENMVTITHLVYALHAFAVFSALIGSATIIFSFVASLPSIAAVVLNYWNQNAVRGTWPRATSAGRSGPSGSRCCGSWCRA